MSEAAADLLAHLRMLDVTIGVEDGNLRLNAARGVLSAELKTEIAAAKPALLALLARSDSLHEARVAPVSYAQRRMWLLDRIQGGSTAYTIPGILRLHGELNVSAFERAIQEIVSRHEVLRTTFDANGGEPVQRIHAASTVAIEHIDWTSVPHAEIDARAAAFAREVSRRPFDLERGPLTRVFLAKIAAADHLLFAATHHIVSDGWSMGVFVRELTALYSAFAEGRLSPLRPLRVQYADYARAERRRAAEGGLAAQAEYWSKQLGAPLPSTELPADRPRPAVMNFDGARARVPLSAELSASVQSLADREGVSLFMLLFAAFTALVHRYTRQTDLVVGTPVANRTRAATEEMIGFFVNTIVLRTRVPDNITFRAFLAQVRDVALEAFANQEVPFEQLVEELKPERDQSRNPFFQLMFVLRHVGDDVLTLPGVTATLPEPFDTGTTKFDLTTIFTEHNGALSLDLEYSTALFDRETAENFGACLTRLLESVVAAPDARIADLEIVPESQRALLADWGRQLRGVTAAGAIHERFEAMAARTPGAIALTFDGANVTYADLDRQASRLAQKLRAQGVQPGAIVGICMNRSVELVAGIIAILKCGAAYLPLDPSYPHDRVAFMLSDSRASVVLTRPGDDAVLANAGVPVIHDGPDEGVDPSQGTSVPADALAYVIYTSGSTGTPKGVGVTHANVLRLFDATDDWFNFGANDVWTLFHSVAFDFSVWEIWGALAYGGRLVVVPYEVTRSPDSFHALLHDEHVTVLNQTPSAFRQLVAVDATAGARTFPDLRLVIFGGEALDLAMLRPWIIRHGDAQPALINMYGITETTVHVTYRRILDADVSEGRGSVIGRQIPDLSLRLLDPHGRPVPVGVAGELFVGGGGVARGYLNRPELTAQRFVPDPSDATGHARLYRTGDLARYRYNGDLEYIGRIDDQVKIRGFRIELGEIESALAADARVTGALAVIREDVPGDRRIVAYVTSVDGAIGDELRNALRSRLPDYMVPAAIVVLDTFPLTSNGKIDRTALPRPDRAARPVSAPRPSPTTALERSIATIWSDALSVPDVGLDDNFFDLGGHSLLLVRVHGQIKALTTREFRVVDLFRHTTVRALARFLGDGDTPGLSQDDFAARARQQRASMRMRMKRDDEGR